MENIKFENLYIGLQFYILMCNNTPIQVYTHKKYQKSSEVHISEKVILNSHIKNCKYCKERKDDGFDTNVYLHKDGKPLDIYMDSDIKRKKRELLQKQI
jgi:hypothetical protein